MMSFFGHILALFFFSFSINRHPHGKMGCRRISLKKEGRMNEAENERITWIAVYTDMVKSGSIRLASAVDRKVKYQYLYSSGAVVRADSMSAVVMGSVAVNPGADGRPSATHTHSYYNSQAVCIVPYIKRQQKQVFLYPGCSQGRIRIRVIDFGSGSGYCK